MISQKVAGKLVKAFYAATLTFLSGLSTMLVGTEPLDQVTPGQWVTLAGWSLAAAGSVYGLAGWAGPKMNGASSSDGG